MPGPRWPRPAGKRVERVRATGEVVVGGLPLEPADLDGLGVLHADLDAFYASVEAGKDPRLAGRPLLVGGTGPRGVVSSASYEARAYGVGSAMPASQARRLCPHAIVIPPDFQAYRDKSGEVWGIAAARLDRLQRMGLDEAYAELTGIPKPLRVLRELVADVRDATGIQISVGVGPSRLVAKCCSDLGKPAGFVAMGREEACVRFAPAPTRRLPGIGPKTAERLAALGYATVGHLQQADQAALAARFGERTARYLKERAEFRDDSPVETERGAAKSRSTERTFDADIADVAEQPPCAPHVEEGLVQRQRLHQRGHRAERGHDLP